MATRRSTLYLVIGSLAVVSAVWWLKRPRTPVEMRETEAPIGTLAASPPIEIPPPPPPTQAEARQAVARIFGAALVMDAEPLVAADFNGDGWQDLAVVARPAPDGLSALNAGLANWVIEDPLLAAAPGRLTAKREAVHVEAADLLLAVVHGHEAAGWRNPEARQSLLLRNVVGAGLAPLAYKDVLASGERTPQLLGDVIAVSLAGKPGFVYWTGAHYAWHERKPAGPVKPSPTPPGRP